MTNHPDPTDRASELEELERQSALSLQRERAARNRLLPSGSCHNCEETFGDQSIDPRLFCDQDCRDDWERRRAAQERNGNA